MEMYWDFPVRENFGLKIISENQYDKDVGDGKIAVKKDGKKFTNTNYLIDLGNGKYGLALYTFKTEGKALSFEVGVKKYFSAKTNKLLSNYIKKKGLTSGDDKWLFGREKQTSFISETIKATFKTFDVPLPTDKEVNKEGGSTAGMGANYLRHARITEEYNKKYKNEDDRNNYLLSLAKRMKHGSETQENYVRVLDETDYFKKTPAAKKKKMEGK